MTVINRICFELSDIVAIELECNECNTLICYRPTDWTPTILKCPNSNCGKQLVPAAASGLSEELRSLEELALGIKRVLNNCKSFPFHLRLEFNQPD